jgi:hypothetical protein
MDKKYVYAARLLGLIMGGAIAPKVESFLFDRREEKVVAAPVVDRGRLNLLVSCVYERANGGYSAGGSACAALKSYDTGLEQRVTK